MKYKEGDYVQVTFFGKIVEADEGDEVFPYQVECDKSQHYWISENDIESVATPAFSVDQVINDGFGKTGPVKDINYVRRRKTYQYKVNDEWIDEAALVEVNK